jgi:hypothetical protein
MFNYKNCSFFVCLYKLFTKEKKSTQRKRGEITTGEAHFAVEFDNDDLVDVKTE